jgi:hypothetical protein
VARSTRLIYKIGKFTMVTIVDISSQCASRAAALRAAGVLSVIRYYSRDTVRPTKRLSRDEALAIAGAGMRIGVVHEARRGDLAASFEYASGVADARYARTYGTSTIGQPSGSVIYFAVDFDATAAEVRDLIVPYFRGASDAFAELTGEQNYVIGVYGSGAVCAALLDTQLVKKTWLAQSSGWRGYNAFLSSNRWDLRQEMAQTVAGLDCDPDVAQEGRDFGGFLPAGQGASSPVMPGALVATTNVRAMRVNARSGLRLRAGPGTSFDILQLLPWGTPVSVLKSVDGWALTDLQGDGVADGYVGEGFLSAIDALPATALSAALRSVDAIHVAELIRQGRTAAGLKAARTTAKAALPQYPTNGCAAHLSALLQQAGIDIPMTFGAGKLAQRLKDRGWTRVDVGSQIAGDVGVCFDNDPTPEGADHVYLVIETLGRDEMSIADNQRTADATHKRFASGAGGKTPTEYFLRAL